MAEMSLKLLYLVQLNSSDKETISRGKRGSDPCEALQRQQREAARKDFSRMQVWHSAILAGECQKTKFFQLLLLLV
jgi:hypothetical protein